MKENIKNFILCILGSLIYCIGVNFFIISENLYSGGFVGIAQLLTLLIPFNINFNIQGIIYLILNIPLFIFGYKILGKHFILKSILIIMIESIFLTILPIFKTPIINDVLTNCIVGGCLEGLGIGLTFVGFSSGGGTDILGLILTKKYKNMSVGKVSLTINIFVYIISAYLFSLEVAIYSILASIFCSLIIDKIHMQNNNVSVNILSEKYNEISKIILKDLNRDATILEGIGAYSNKEKKLIVSIMSQYELNILKRKVQEIDSNAFIFIQPHISIFGNFEKRLT